MAPFVIRKESGFYVLENVINGYDVSARYTEENVEQIFLPLLREWTRLQQCCQRRILIFLAAPPAAGKSTLANFLRTLSLQTDGIEPIETIGMDGFHHFQDYLLSHTVTLNEKEAPMVSVKGSPVTFDLPKLMERIRQLKTETLCLWPLYNRKQHNPEDRKICVTGNIVLLEGNYLLLDTEGWRDLKHECDYSVRILADENQVRERLVRRKMLGGITRLEAEVFVDSSDLANVRLCSHMQPADLTLRMMNTGEYVRTGL